jgi:hypothetical protein
MERPVVRRSNTRTLTRPLVRANGRKRERQTGRSESVPAPVEMRLQELGGRRRFERCPGSSRRRHTRDRAASETGMPAEDQDHHKGDTNPECPEVTAASAHQAELNRNRFAYNRLESRPGRPWRLHDNERPNRRKHQPAHIFEMLVARAGGSIKRRGAGTNSTSPTRRIGR